MKTFSYTEQGRRPTAAQIVSAWKKAGKPDHFVVEYGETYAEFNRVANFAGSKWFDGGNGCRGVDRTAVVKSLEAVDAKRKKESADLWY